MNRRIEDKQVVTAMKTDPIHKILASEETILPSSGFLAAVMERVEEESRAPAPIPFPWKRAFLAFPLMAGVLGWSGYELFRSGIPSLGNLSLPQSYLVIDSNAPVDQAAWVALAFVVSILSWKLARRISGQS